MNLELERIALYAQRLNLHTLATRSFACGGGRQERPELHRVPGEAAAK